MEGCQTKGPRGAAASGHTGSPPAATWRPRQHLGVLHAERADAQRPQPRLQLPPQPRARRRLLPLRLHGGIRPGGLQGPSSSPLLGAAA